MMDKVVMWQAVVYTRDPLSGNAGVNEMLAESELQKGGRPAEKTGRDERPVSKTPTLAEVGISKDLSSRAQKLAAVPEAEFEAELAAKRERDQEKAHDALTGKEG